ncbi:unnamed protein product [Lepeophtheirus salmonis]|uniref:Pecanex-like protein n=1 Tax=Lepeophtheirus salmonis TaxID=72036 RepID=A0A7R8CNJ4_LEPSM|nr:unnamed protein product [Lepeophtheirus salmonis]CAF2830298.1 unnamed protein product [Lepeophtheirus salmonis]
MVSKIFKAIGLIRILRYIWQYTGFALSELAIYHLYTFFNLKKGIPIKLNAFTELLIIGFLRDRLVLLSKKLYFVAVCSVSSLEERASKRSYAGCLFQLNILISPFLLCLAIISSILQCPLYAFFSLPIFGIAYPRSRRFWPDAPTHSSSDSDAIYYEQMHDSFLTSLHSKLNCGKLYPYEPGDHFLARYEDKILWTTVLECGNGYAYYRVKGTELQHTSCHSLEATRIDDIFRIAFEEDKPSLFNRFAFHCLTPIGSIEVKTYSDTKNVLTGIIEASDTLKLVAELYLKTLIWYLLKYLKETGKSHSNESANKISGGVFIRSESVEAINLDSWPPSNESTWVETLRQSAYIKTHKPTFVDDDAIDEVSDFEIDDLPLTPSKRKGLLPPILNEEIGSSKNNRNSEESIILQLENIFIPGGIENQSRVPKKEINGNFTSITPPKTPIQISFTQSKDLPIPPMDWLHFPSLSSIRREEIYSDIDEEWLSLILYNFFEFQEDQVNYNLDCYKHVLCGCFGSIYESNVDITSKGPNLFVNAFHSRFTNLILPDNLISKIITPAFKCAIKLALDEKIFYNNISDSKEDLIEAIKEIDNNWYLGNESELKWNDSIIKEVPHLFSLKGVEGRSKNTLYRSRLLSLQIANVYVGKLNSELVHGLWASLNLELLYLTNDDDERYSIQAEERLLRNLTVQVADPPLGYAIFTSSPLRKSID